MFSVNGLYGIRGGDGEAWVTQFGFETQLSKRPRETFAGLCYSPQFGFIPLCCLPHRVRSLFFDVIYDMEHAVQPFDILSRLQLLRYLTEINFDDSTTTDQFWLALLKNYEGTSLLELVNQLISTKYVIESE